MPTRRCCGCGPCFTYAEDFIRPDEDETLLEPDWETCDTWTDWELTTLGPSNGQIEGLTAGALLILKHMAGNPYGILQGHIQVVEGLIYRIHTFHGTEEDPCSGPTHFVEIDYTDLSQSYIRIMTGSTVLAEVEFDATVTSDTDFEVCVGDRIIEATVSESARVRWCGDVSGYWFALESETTGTIWSEIFYSDHWEHNRDCPRCSQHCCFSGFDQVIAGFRGTIHGIADGSCTCATSWDFEIRASDEADKCACYMEFLINPDGEDHYEPGPHECSPARSTMIATMDCRATGDIVLVFSIDPDDFGESESTYSITFPAGTDPSDILSAHLDVEDAGDERSCNYDDSWIEFEPILVDGCCSEVIEETAMELRAASSRLVGWVEWLRKPEEKGVGDTVERLLSMVGGRTIKKALQRLGLRCGCKSRQKWLNQRYPY